MNPATAASIGSHELAMSSVEVIANKFRMSLPPVSLLSAAMTIALLTKQRPPQGQQPQQKKQYLYPLNQSSRPQLFSLLPSGGLPLATLFFMVALVTVFHLQSTGALVMGKLSLCPWRVLKKKEYYRLLSHVFIHTDYEHLMTNLVGAFIFGFECESAYGTLRLAEASVWATILENIVQVGLAKQTFVQLPGTSSQAMMHAHMVGFSGILNFWLGMGFTRHFWLNFCFIGLVVTREVMRYSVKRGSIAHIAGAFGGMLYSLFILDHFTIPKGWVQTLERRLPIAKSLYVSTPPKKRWYI